MPSRSPNRRDFLRLTLGALGTSVSAALVMPPRLAAAQAATPLRTTSLRDGLVQIESDHANVLLLRTPAGGVLVDSGAPDTAAALSQAVTDHLGGAPLAALFNTHWHLDHTGANDAFGKAGATRIIAHENTRLWMSTEYYVDWENKTYEPRAPEALPNDTFHSSDPQPLVLDLGGERIEYGHLREAHTDGDIYVRFRERNVIAAGGAAGGGAYPIIDYATGGWIGGLIDANKKLLELANADTLIVGHAGAVQTRSQLQAQHEMLRTMRERVEDLMRKGKSAAEMVASGVTEDFDGRYGTDSALFIRNTYEGLWWAGRLTNSL
jgi:cyclase